MAELFTKMSFYFTDEYTLAIYSLNKIRMCTITVAKITISCMLWLRSHTEVLCFIFSLLLLLMSLQMIGFVYVSFFPLDMLVPSGIACLLYSRPYCKNLFAHKISAIEYWEWKQKGRSISYHLKCSKCQRPSIYVSAYYLFNRIELLCNCMRNFWRAKVQTGQMSLHYQCTQQLHHCQLN